MEVEVGEVDRGRGVGGQTVELQGVEGRVGGSMEQTAVICVDQKAVPGEEIQPDNFFLIIYFCSLKIQYYSFRGATLNQQFTSLERYRLGERHEQPDHDHLRCPRLRHVRAGVCLIDRCRF